MRAALLSWFDQGARDLPWRSSGDPYAIWVSEIMLQQTRVVTVLEYYERWMQRFPNVSALATAPLDDVLELWAGLGYYRRARLLHRAAGVVVETFGGRLPETAQGLRALPGIGPYTAGAIASIAFGEPTPLVDGNVERILARLRSIPGDPKSTPNQKLFWRLAAALVSQARPGDLNQALMELGAIVCTPKSPSCLLCPVRSHCHGLRDGDPARFPAKVKKAKVKRLAARVMIVVTPEPWVLLRRRPDDGLWGGLWEFPTHLEDEVDASSTLQESADAWLETLAGDTSSWERHPLGTVVHKLTHREITFEASLLSAPEAAELLDETCAWCTPEELGSLGVSTATRKLEALLPDAAFTAPEE